jgi:hypothetical protein
MKSLGILWLTSATVLGILLFLVSKLFTGIFAAFAALTQKKGRGLRKESH